MKTKDIFEMITSIVFDKEFIEFIWTVSITLIVLMIMVTIEELQNWAGYFVMLTAIFCMCCLVIRHCVKSSGLIEEEEVK